MAYRHQEVQFRQDRDPRVAQGASGAPHSLGSSARDQERRAVVVREATTDDIDAITSLLVEQFPAIPADHWSTLFDYDWCPSKPNFGFVLVDGTEIVGFHGAIYSDREIHGRRERFSNGSSCYVRPAYRGYSMDLILSFLAQPGYTFTSLTPNPVATRIHEALGFRLLEQTTRFIPPLLQAHTLLHSMGLRVLTRPEEIAPHLSGSQAQILRDHAPYPCRHYLALSKEGSCYIVTRSIMKYRMRFSEILHVSDPSVMTRHLERIKLRILRKEKALWLMVDERMFGARPPLSLRRRRLRYFVSDSLNADDIDSLYTEYVLIPEVH